MKMKKQHTVVGLFAGCGGLDLGFLNAGFSIVWANDFMKEAVETYKKNIGDHIILGDITKIPSSEIPDNFDILLGGFPCQGFSIANIKRSMKDERNYLYKEMLRVIKDKRPKYFDKWDKEFASWDYLVDTQNISPMEYAINYVIAYSKIDKVIVGVDNGRQLLELLSACDIEFEQELNSLVIDDLGLIDPSRWSL